MALLPNTTLETHPSGTINKNGIINGNWEIIERILNPALSSGDPLFGLVANVAAVQRALTTVAYAASVNIDLTKTLTRLALTGNVTIAFTNKAAGRGTVLLLTADGTDRTVTWPAGVNWSGAPTLLVRANSAAVVYIASGTAADTGIFLQGPPAEPAPAWETLVDGATVTWPWVAWKAVQQAAVTLGGARTLDITGMTNGQRGTLLVTQDGTGGRTLAMPASTLVEGAGAGAVPLTATAGAVDLLRFERTGANFLVTVFPNFT
jgi:hypothetical protein